MGDSGEDRVEQSRVVYCKVYHRPKTADHSGSLRGQYQRKSTCPSWAIDPKLQKSLIDDALIDSAGKKDAYGHPKTLWNAVEGFIFVGVSSGLQIPQYSCHPERPPDGKHFAELQRRAERTRDQVLQRPEISDG